MRMTKKQVQETFFVSEKLIEPLRIVSQTSPQIDPQTTLFKNAFEVDVELEFQLENGQKFDAAVDFTDGRSRQYIRQAIARKRTRSYQQMGFILMVVCPYIGTEQGNLLRRNNISWIDLSGNMYINVPGKVYIERLGNKNKYPDSSTIKNIYSGTSALVSRALLTKADGFSSQNEIVDYINSRGGNITVGTVSKVLSKLEEELFIIKMGRIGILSDSIFKLIDQLIAGYQSSFKKAKKEALKLSYDGDDCNIFGRLYESGCQYAACGLYAAQRKGLAVSGQLEFFVSDANRATNFLRQSLGVQFDSEFGNLAIMETKEPGVWFDLDINGMYKSVCDLELYMEMMLTTPRGPKIAEELKEKLWG